MTEATAASMSSLCTSPKAFLAVTFFVASVVSAASEEVRSASEIGAHHRVLIVEKNVNPQNMMVIYTKVDADGRFSTDPANRNQPVFDFYWLMDGRDYKPVNAMIKAAIRKRFESQWYSRDEANRFTVNVNDLKEVNCDIKEPKMDVYARDTGGKRSVEAEMTLGPSDGNLRIKLSSIYTEGRAVPPALHAVTLKGKEIVNGNVTGRVIIRKYVAKR